MSLILMSCYNGKQSESSYINELFCCTSETNIVNQTIFQLKKNKSLIHRGMNCHVLGLHSLSGGRMIIYKADKRFLLYAENHSLRLGEGTSRSPAFLWLKNWGPEKAGGTAKAQGEAFSNSILPLPSPLLCHLPNQCLLVLPLLDCIQVPTHHHIHTT